MGTRVDSHGTNDLTDNATVLYGTGKKKRGTDFETSNSEFYQKQTRLIYLLQGRFFHGWINSGKLTVNQGSGIL